MPSGHKHKDCRRSPFWLRGILRGAGAGKHGLFRALASGGSSGGLEARNASGGLKKLQKRQARIDMHCLSSNSMLHQALD